MNKLLVVFSFFAIYFIWGTTYLAIVIGLEGFQPFFMAAIRFIIAGLLLVGYSMYRGEKFPTWTSLKKNTFIGLIVLCGGQGLLIWSEQHIASGFASILVATLPIWYVVLDKKHWNEYLRNPYIILGIVLGFGGILLLFRDTLTSSATFTDTRLQLIATGLVLFGAICWVTGTLYQRSKPAPGSIFHNLGWQLIIASGLCMIISFILGEWQESPVIDPSLTAWSAVLYLSVAGSIMAFVAYTWLLQEMPSAVVGSYAYVNPVVAVFLGWLLAEEVVSSWQLSGMVVILLSAILVNINRNKVKDTASAE